MLPSDDAPTTAASELTGWSFGLLLAAIAAARRGKAVHPKGVVHAANLTIDEGNPAPTAARLLSQPKQHDAIVRFSRSLGLPHPLPDLFGISLRVTDAYGPNAHQDLLMVTSADVPILHHIFLPTTGIEKRPYSSSLPFEAGGERFVVGALPRSPTRFDLAIARPRGRFQRVGRIDIGERLPQELDATLFEPWNGGGGMTPAGFLNGARKRAYTLSQAAWRRAR